MPHQQQAVDFIASRPASGVWLGVGSGKAQPLDAKILTPTGFIRMRQAEIGTEIITPSGDIAAIDGVFPQGRRPVYALRLHDGRVVEADEDHIWSVATDKHRENGTFVRRTTRQLLGDLQRKGGAPKWSIAQIAPVDLGKWSSSIDPWLLGVLLGDGGLTCGSPTLSMPDQQIVDLVTELLPSGVTPKKIGETDDYRLTISDERRSNPLLDELRRIGVWSHSAGTKSVPRDLLHSPVSDRLALLQGLLDTDGTPSGPGFDVVFKSEQLADDVRWLTHSLGGRASKGEKIISAGPYAGNVYHRVYGRLPNNLEPFRLARKRDARRPHNDGRRRSYDTLYTSISEITFRGYEETQCIRVDHPSHEYVTDGFVRTHNTITALSALQHIRPIGHILVIAPVAIARSTWLDEIEERGFTIRTRSLIVDERDRKLSKAARLERIRQVFTDPPTMYFINQDLISRSPDKRCKVCHGDGLKHRPCTSCQTGLVDQMPIQKINGTDGKLRDTIIWPFQTVIIDESQEFKSHSSNRFKGLKKVRPAITRFIELTGTPAPNGLEDLWSQIYLLDQGQALGATITEFRRRWFTPKMIPGTTTPAAWLPNTGAEEQIHKAISHLVMSAQNSTVVLPPLTIENVHVRLPAHLMDAYKAFKRELVIDVVNDASRRKAEQAYDLWIQQSPEPEAQVIRDHLATLTGSALADAYAKYKTSKVQDFLQDPDAQLIKTVIAENQAVLTSKLMQFASGTLYTADPDDPSTKGQYEILHDEKIQMAEYLIRNNGGDPVLVAYHFKSDREQLMLKLNKAGIKAEIFDGSREMTQRWSTKQIQVMLIHPASAGAGLNLQHGGSTMIWFTMPFSLKHYLQTNGRLFRTGQTKPVRIYQLITKGTQDERMPVVLQTKELTQDRLIQAVDVEQGLELALMDEIRDDLNDLWTTTRL